MSKLTPGDEWYLLIKECPACGASPLVVARNGDDYLVDCGDCKFKFSVWEVETDKDGDEVGIVFEILHAATHCACGLDLTAASS